MAHRQRITEDSSVQMPNVRACSPFTAHREGKTAVRSALANGESVPPAAGRALTETGAAGIELLREEAVVAEALQRVPGGDDRHHDEPAAQHVQEAAHPAAAAAATAAAAPRRAPAPGLRPAPPSCAPIGCGCVAPRARHEAARATSANRRPLRAGPGPAPTLPVARGGGSVARARWSGRDGAGGARAVRAGRGRPPPVVVVTGKRREWPPDRAAPMGL